MWRAGAARYGDGQYRAVLGFQKAGNTWVAQNAACAMKNSSPLDALMMHFVLASFREIASDMVTLGHVKSVQSVVFQNWLKRVAAGEIAISDTVPKPAPGSRRPARRKSFPALTGTG